MIAWNERHEATYKTTPEGRQDHIILLNPNTGESTEYHIMNSHSFDDFGQTIETVQVWNPITKDLFEIYSMDEGETFSSEMQEAI